MSKPAHRARKIVGMMVMSSIIAIAALFGTVLWLSNAANKLAADQSRKLVESELKAVSTELSSIIRHTGRWDNSHEWVTTNDIDSIINEIGPGTGPRGPFNSLYIISSIGTPLFAFADGERLPRAMGYNLELVNVVRSEMRHFPLEPYQIASGYIATSGRIAMVSAGRIQKIDSSDLNVSTIPILIGARWFTETDLQGIGARLQLDGVRLDYWNTEPRIGTQSVPLLDMSGRAIAHVSWWPPRPGDLMLERVQGVVLAIAVIMFLSSFFVGQAAVRQTNALVSEMQMARTDNLTGLLNRTGLDQAVDTQEFQAALSLGEVALLYVDINDFKPLNDTFGHAVGDLALELVSKRLRNACRTRDIVARLGGDEFVCAIIDPHPKAAADRVADNVNRAMAQPFTFEQGETVLSISVGIAVASSGSTWQDVLAKADLSMYLEKEQHRETAMNKSAA